jgi:hypothetical protein
VEVGRKGKFDTDACRKTKTSHLFGAQTSTSNETKSDPNNSTSPKGISQQFDGTNLKKRIGKAEVTPANLSTDPIHGDIKT